MKLNPTIAEALTLGGSTLAVDDVLTSWLEGHKRLDTPHLDVRYRAPQKSQHAKG